MAVRTKLMSLGLTIFFLLSLMLFLASPVLASEGGSEDLMPVYDNGLAVAIGGVLGIYLFLGFILFRVLRKRKKQILHMR